MTSRIEQAARVLYEDDTGNSADRKQSTLPSSPQRNDLMPDTFTASTHCPRCNTIAVHPLRAPNPDPPKQIHPPGTTQIIAWGGQIIAEDHDDGLDRWDEQPYEIIRTCTRCGHEWGQQ